MSRQVDVRCECGKVRGVATDVAPNTGNRIVCYCEDCQAFARFLERPEVLDAAGGTDIFQMAPARLRITEGAALFRCVRLSDRGMYRWYTDCCRTPVANTIGARPPFVAIIHAFMDLDARARDEIMGKPLVYTYGRDAIGGMPPQATETAPVGFMLRALRLMFGWWITGKGSPSTFFDRTGAPRVTPHVLSAAERDVLRHPPSATEHAKRSA